MDGSTKIFIAFFFVSPFTTAKAFPKDFSTNVLIKVQAGCKSSAPVTTLITVLGDR